MRYLVKNNVILLLSPSIYEVVLSFFKILRYIYIIYWCTVEKYHNIILCPAYSDRDRDRLIHWGTGFHPSLWHASNVSRWTLYSTQLSCTFIIKCVFLLTSSGMQVRTFCHKILYTNVQSTQGILCSREKSDGDSANYIGDHEWMVYHTDTEWRGNKLWLCRPSWAGATVFRLIYFLKVGKIPSLYIYIYIYNFSFYLYSLYIYIYIFLSFFAMSL